jgi:hypothetical protein
MHVLSELRNPLFEAPDRPRALRALQLSRLLKENNHTKPWEAVKNMIDKIAGENVVSRDGVSGSTPLGGTPGAAPRIGPSTSKVSIPVYSEPMSTYSPPQPMMPQSMPPQPMRQSMAPIQQDTPQFNWDDLNFSNIVGDTQPPAELPEFDFVSFLSSLFRLQAHNAQGFWGDPINFGSDPLTFPLESGYTMSWAS